MKRMLLLFIVLTLLRCTEEKSQYSDYPISSVNVKNVRITDDFWLPKIKLIQDTTISYAFSKCEEEGRMKNFLIAGGIIDDTAHGEMPFDDTDLYKIIEGAAYSLISKPNDELDFYIDSIISIIKIGQEPDGYLTTWFTIDRERPPAWWVKPSTERWEHLESSHELYNSGHMFEAAAAHYWATGKENMLDIALKNADLLVDNFGPGKLRIPPGHQIVETGLIKLYQITHNTNYLELAKFFLDARGDSTYEKSSGEYSQDHLPVIKQSEAVGHAVRALYMYAGMTDIAVMFKDKDYLNAVHAIWDNTYNKKMYITGGLGSRHDGESFGDNYELPNLTAYNETCASIASVIWNHRLFLLTGDAKYYDILERTLYNGLLSGISVEGKEFFYPNPTESDGKYKFNQGACTRKSWFDCSCCPTNLIRFFPSLPGLIYATHKDSLFVNLFISNDATVQVDNEEVTILQHTEYPWNGTIHLTVSPSEQHEFTLKIRIPGWARNQAVPGDLYSYIDSNPGEISLSVNEINEKLELKNGYAKITRIWNKGDKVKLKLPMNIKVVTSNPKVEENLDKIELEYGPIVYCAEEADNPDIDKIRIRNDMNLSIENELLLNQNIKVIKGEFEGTNLKLIPFYLWSNRGVGKMKVWLPLMQDESSEKI